MCGGVGEALLFNHKASQLMSKEVSSQAKHFEFSKSTKLSKYYTKTLVKVLILLVAV